MVFLNRFKEKNIAIYGMGLTGQSSAKKLIAMGANVFCWDDDKKTRKRSRELKFKINKFWLEKKEFDNIILSPGIDIEKCSIKRFLKKNSKKILTDLDLFFEINKDVDTISITGTNGKSTTCKLVEKILKFANYSVITAGNIGKPILSLTNIKKNKILILEVSSYQLQYSKLFRSKHAAILNISPDHLERHKNIKNYTIVKSKIFSSQNNLDYSYINSTNKHLKFLKKLFKNKKFKSKLNLVSESSCKSILEKINNNYFKSKGNIENLAFAYKICKNFKIKNHIIIKALNKFKGLPHRQEKVFSKKKILCINDSKATSFDASLQSLSNYNKIYWILGGVPKYNDYFGLENVKKNIVKAYIIGKNISFFEKKINKTIPFLKSYSMKNAINSIIRDLKENKKLNGTILLSPAGASFDQFKNFENRGNYFKKLIKKNLKKINV